MPPRGPYRQSPVLVTALLAVLLGCAAPAPSVAADGCAGGGRPRPDEGGIGGTGIQAARPVDQGGIGGTGIRSNGPGDDGGIGGTGIAASADTGIIGTVTGFGSICVGGVEIHYGAETPVQIDGLRATAEQLAVGQIVEVRAAGTGAEVSAREISVRHVVSGPVTLVEPGRNVIEVMGQPVELSGVTRGGGSDTEQPAVAAAFRLNTFVAVSGFRRADGAIVASRVTPGELPGGDAGRLVQTTGPVTRIESGGLWIGDTAVRPAGPVSVAVGDEVHVAGQWDGGALIAASISATPRLPFDGHVAHVDIEGFARPSASGQLHVGPFAVEVPAAAQDARHLPAPDTRVRVQAIIQNRQVIVEHLGVMDELPPLPPAALHDTTASGGSRPADGHSNGSGTQPDPSRPGGGWGGAPHDGWSSKPDGGAGVPPGPVWGDRPPAPALPDRPIVPQVPDRPQLPDRPNQPQPPDRPQLPQRPDRPPRPDRAEIPPRPEVPRRP